MEKITIGYFMSKAKKKKMDWDTFKEYAESQDVIIEEIDTNNFTSEQKYDIIIGKFTDFLVKGTEKSKELERNFEKWINEGNVKTVVDSMDAQRNCISRESISHFGEFLETNVGDVPIKNPKTLVITENERRNNYTELLNEKGINFPVICKPNQACGSLESHEMGVVFNESQIHQFDLPCVIQEFYNHGGVINKVFVCGLDEFSVVKRPSITDITYEENHEPIIFNSQDMSHLMNNDTENYEIPSDHILSSIIKLINKKFDLNLFGFDLIQNNITGKYAVVDINFFPGYKGLDNFHEKLLNCLLGVHKSKHNNNNDN
eukprot:TRINITY_DN3889_c0_g1_i1.p1 TRINITY_DN3889_c0_g1~~TRINITY_DN3889_c0_g1_i1.p1  ORF type:complete len:317 (-),score=89.10 TRINITY_DN3889_c0_g1_i1:38-988(-)